MKKYILTANETLYSLLLVWCQFTIPQLCAHCFNSLNQLCSVQSPFFSKISRLSATRLKGCNLHVTHKEQSDLSATTMMLGTKVGHSPDYFFPQTIFCTNLKCTHPFVQFKFSVYGHTQTDRQSCNAVPLSLVPRPSAPRPFGKLESEKWKEGLVNGHCKGCSRRMRGIH